VPLAALTDPVNSTLYFVLTASALDGVKIAVLPLHVMLLAATALDPTGLTRNVFLLIDLQRIGRLKFTVILVLTYTLMAPSTGFVETTTGRGFIEASAAGDRPTHKMITKAANATLLIMVLSVIARPFCFADRESARH